MSNVFVLCAGRTASTSFTHACAHITNYSCAHESRVGLLGDDRLRYPENHIEVDNRLAWFLTRLDKVYGKDAYYINLTRDSEAIARSYCERWHLNESIVKAYAHGLLMNNKIRKQDRMKYCMDYVDTVNYNITQFLADKPKVMTIDVTELTTKFPDFFQFIKAQGDLEKCIKKIGIMSNKNKPHPLKKLLNRFR